LLGDEGEPSSYVAEKMLKAMGFSSTEEFNQELSSHKKGELPRDLQERILKMFDIEQTDKSTPYDHEPIRISDGIVESLSQQIELQNPFICNLTASTVEIYGMSFEPNGDTTTVSIRAGISIENFLQPRSMELKNICDVITNKLVPLTDESLFNKWDEEGIDLPFEEYQENWLSDSTTTISKWLESQSITPSLSKDIDFLTELGQQCLYLIGGAGLNSKLFEDNDGAEYIFWIEGEEESGFDDD